MCTTLFLKAKARSILERVAHAQQSGSDIESIREILNMEVRAARLEARIDTARNIIGTVKYMNWVELLQEVSAVIPRTMWLTRLSWKEDDSVTLNGYALSYDSVSRLRDKLVDSSYFDSVKFVSAENGIVEADVFVKFKILCGTRMGQ
jgi:Tfp pilus assembly protein PilN